LAVEQEAVIHVLISLAILLFAAKIFAELFNKLKLPAVLGELCAGIIVGPFALGSLPLFDGKPVVILDETVRQIGEISGIVILFIAGLEITPRIPERRSRIVYSRCVRCYSSILCRVLRIHSFWSRCVAICPCGHSTHCN
jgi:hypothetical protein